MKTHFFKNMVRHFSKSEDFMTCPLFFAVKAVCPGFEDCCLSRGSSSINRRHLSSFLRDKTLNFCTCMCLICRCRAFHDFYFIFRQIFGFSYFQGYLGLKGSHISSGEKKKKRRKWLGRGTVNTVCKIQGLSLKNGVDIWTFVR